MPHAPGAVPESRRPVSPGVMMSSEASDNSGSGPTVCPRCGRRFVGRGICPGCGALPSATSPAPSGPAPGESPLHTSPSRPAAVDQRSSGFVSPGSHESCAKCGQSFVCRPARTGTVLCILGMGVLVLLCPFVRSFLLAVVGFGLLAWGMWKQANPTSILKCPHCGGRAGRG